MIVVSNSAGAFMTGAVPLRLVKRRPPLTHHAPRVGSLVTAARRLGETLRVARSYPQTLRFLIAYVLYADGIAAVLTLSSQFGSEELGLAQDTLIQAVLLVQVVGALGALIFAGIAERIGAKRAVMPRSPRRTCRPSLCQLV